MAELSVKRYQPVVRRVRWLARWVLTMAFVLGGAATIRAFGASAGSSAPSVSPGALSQSALLPLGLVFVGLLVCSGLISSSETALFSLDKLDLNRLRSSKRWYDRTIIRLLDRPNDTLVTILILNNFANISASLTAGAVMDRELGEASALGFTLAAVVATSGILIVGEILPKLLALHTARRSARVLAPPLAMFSAALSPFRWLINLLLGGLYRLMAIPERPEEEISEEELKAMISSGEVSQVLEADEREMIDGVFDLRRTVAEQIMTPRLLITAIPDDLTQEQMLARLQEIPNNRVLVYHESLDELAGFLLVKEVLLSPDRPWREHLREALCVPERVGLLNLLKIFRRQRTKMAVVVDEFGAVTGIVTLQDLLEEIVGDIYEQHEHPKQDIQPIGPRRWRVAGSAELFEVADLLKIDVPETMGRTVGGFVMNSLGRIPQVGDELTMEGWIFIVREMSGRRVHALEIVAEPTDHQLAGKEPGR